MKVSEKLADIAALSLEAGCPVIFKRLIRASIMMADHDTDGELSRGIDEAEDREEDEEIGPDSEDNDEDEDVEGFAGFPMGALPYKERRRGPHHKDVGVGKPDWWNP
ncbi:MAG: hypothetical protein DRH08_13610 [Deltaproteobacteria bacterium]|nr:MAG: hypothetical protein DRH08_13610 [Deltaproteobacteria bacterium]